MAKQVEVNKTQAIKDYLAGKPDAPPKEIADALNESGIKVSAAYVSTIKSTLKKKSGGGGGGGAPRGRRPKSADLSMSMLEEAKEIASKLGGVQQAKRIFDFLSSLSS